MIVGLKKLKLAYEQDLFPGEYFGEIALEGVYHRAVTVQALTDIELLSIEHDDYIASRGHSLHHNHALRVEDKHTFLRHIALFRDYDKYNLSRFAHAMSHEEVSKGAKIMFKNEACPHLYFIWRGSVDLMRKIPVGNNSLLLQQE